jgi:hypothetical protein
MRRAVMALSNSGAKLKISHSAKIARDQLRLRGTSRLRLAFALSGTSIRFDIVVRIVRPETDSPSGAQPPRLSGGRKRAADI